MDGWQIGYSVALAIGMVIVGWCTRTIVQILERASVLETRLSKCKCAGHDHAA